MNQQLPDPCGYCQFVHEDVMCRAPLPPGYLVCADCYDLWVSLNPHPGAIETTVVEPREPIRWGRWVPPLLFLAVVVTTLFVASTGLLFWAFVLIPGMAFGWIFGFGPGRPVEHFEPSPYEDPAADFKAMMKKRDPWS
jgi:hypothetical protein